MGSVIDFVFLLVLPAVAVVIAWVAAVRSWRKGWKEAAPASEERPSLIRKVVLFMLPVPLLLFGLSLSFLYLGGDLGIAPDSLTLAAAVAYGVPALLAGLGIAFLYNGGAGAAVSSRERFGMNLSIAVQPLAPALFGMVMAFLLVGRATNLSDWTPAVTNAAWLASILISIGGVGGLATPMLAGRAWDFQSMTGYRRALRRSAMGSWWSLLFLVVGFLLLPTA